MAEDKRWHDGARASGWRSSGWQTWSSTDDARDKPSGGRASGRQASTTERVKEEAPPAGVGETERKERVKENNITELSWHTVKTEVKTERAKEEQHDGDAASSHGPFSRQEVERSRRHGPAKRAWRPSDGHTGKAKVPSEEETSIRLEQRRLDQERRVLDQTRSEGQSWTNGAGGSRRA